MFTELFFFWGGGGGGGGGGLFPVERAGFECEAGQAANW